MKFLNRDDNALTLVHFDSGKMHFVYKSLQYSALFGVFAFAVGAAVWFLIEEHL